MAVLDHHQLELLWMSVGGNAAASDIAAAVAQAESGGNPDVIDNTAYPLRPGYHKPPPGGAPEYSVGLWQINLLAHPGYTLAQMLDVDQNAKAAIAISENGTAWGAWTTYTKGAYRQYLTRTVPGGGGELNVPEPQIRLTADHGWNSLVRGMSRIAPRNIAYTRTMNQGILRLTRRHH